MENNGSKKSKIKWPPWTDRIPMEGIENGKTLSIIGRCKWSFNQASLLAIYKCAGILHLLLKPKKGIGFVH